MGYLLYIMRAADTQSVVFSTIKI